MSSIDWTAIEEKWIKKWDSVKLFEAEPDDSKAKYFVTVAYPYPNSPQHIGHGRTYTLADAHARYMRMKGYNVLFPMGFHYTGTPILGMSRRVAAGDPDLIETFHEIYKLTDDVIKTFVEPVKIASYFHNEIKIGMKEMGYSMDWRREFTTIDKMYSKFISWQFRTLREKGLIVQGSHPVGWCPRDQNPVSQHDTLGDVEPDFNEYVLVKFQVGDHILPTATLRPETIFGVTNLWINPEAEYLKILVDGKEKWIVSKEAARKLEFLDHSIAIQSSLRGNELVGSTAAGVFGKAPVPIYPAPFVEADSGTGVVMSVPAHAPYDYQALSDLKQNSQIQKDMGFTVDASPIKIIESEGFENSIPAMEVTKKFKITSQTDPNLEKATSELYNHEFYKGRMSSSTGKFAGMLISEAKELVRKEIAESGKSEIMYELVNKPVKCRCGAECVVKILNDQWFLDYGNKEWKTLAHECAHTMDIVPQDIRQEFDYVIDWLRERACARKSGLGTKLPWDQEWIVESLSDSVIYMAYYVIAKYINSKAITDIDSIQDSFFDYVLLGKGDVHKVAAECNLEAALVEQVRSEFSYFYPVDARHSGRDLVPNHLSFFIFNHVAIFGKENWPQQIVVNGSVLMDGKKMSKSLGNIIPLRKAIKDNGADPIRLSMLVSAEILQDADFTFETVKGIKSKLYGIYEMASLEQPDDESVTLEAEDRWLLSRVQRIVAETTASMDRLRVREAIHHILYALDQDLLWYTKRTSAKGREKSPVVLNTLAEFLRIRVKMLAPFAPFISEEIWEKIKGKSGGLVTSAKWPEVDENKIDITAEESELLVQNLLQDIQNIIKVAKIAPKKIVIYTSAKWKLKIYRVILESVLQGKSNFGDVMKQLVSGSETPEAKKDPNTIKKMMDDILSSPLDARGRRLRMAEFDENLAIKDAAKLLSSEVGSADAVVEVYSEEDISKYDPKGKARFARPFKPAVFME